MLLRRLWLTDFRNYGTCELDLDDGLTAIVGANGHGKSNLIEAIGYLATTESFRGAPTEALIRTGAERSFVRAEIGHRDRDVLVEAEIALHGRGRVLVNKQRLARARDLLGIFRVTVFAPDDLAIVKGGPALRRGYLDDLAVALSPKIDLVRADYERIVKQRNTLLKQAGGRLNDEVALTLDVWDEKLAAAGEALAAAREAVVRELMPLLAQAYDDLAGSPAAVTIRYDAPWRSEGLATALARARPEDLRRAVTSVGPHRDELVAAIGAMPARTHASQGEQRTLALALRLAGHELVRARFEDPPVLLLDDVFSELDPARSAALLAHLPAGQIVLTAAGPLPAGVEPQRRLCVHDGRVST